MIYVEFYVSNIISTSIFYRMVLGFQLKGIKNNGEVISHLLVQNEIFLIITSPLKNNSAIAFDLFKYGEVVKDVAIQVEDVKMLFDVACCNGAKPVKYPLKIGQNIETAKIETFGNFHHSLYNNSISESFFYDNLGFTMVPNVNKEKNKIQLKKIDHIAIAVDDLKKWQNFYQQVFDFNVFSKELVHTKISGMDSTVMFSNNQKYKFVLVRPLEGKVKSQIEIFLEYNGGSGVQHLAFGCDNIFKTVEEIKANGIDLLPVPDEYYSNLTDNVVKYLGDNFQKAKELGILIDYEESRYLLQTFTKHITTRPTFFLEFISRKGLSGFGQNNIKALFEAIEREQNKGEKNA